MKKVINSSKNPTPVGPYSQSVVVGNLCFTSGQLPFDQEKNTFELVDIKAATNLCLSAIENICHELGVTKDAIVKCTILIDDLSQYSIVNEVYGEFFIGDYPARTAYEVAKLPFGVPIEIEAIIECGEL